MTAPNLANHVYWLQEANSQKFFPLYSKKQASNSVSSSSPAAAVGGGLSAKGLHGPSPSNTAPGVIGQLAFLTLAWLLLGGLQEAAEHQVNSVNSVIHTLPQNPGQLCQVLLNVLLQEAHHVIHCRLDDPSQGLKTTKARVEHSQKHPGKHKAHRAQSWAHQGRAGWMCLHGSAGINQNPSWSRREGIWVLHPDRLPWSLGNMMKRTSSTLRYPYILCEHLEAFLEGT